MLNVVEVAPATFVNAPPAVLTCHCTVGAGFPVAAAVNVAVAPAATVTFAGLIVIAGAVFIGAGLLPAGQPARRAQPATTATTVATVDRYDFTDRPLRWAPADVLPLTCMDSGDTKVALAVERVIERKRAVMRADMELLCDADGFMYVCCRQNGQETLLPGRHNPQTRFPMQTTIKDKSGQIGILGGLKQRFPVYG